MSFKRNVELQTLQNYYNRTDNQIVVLYGQKYSGRLALLKDFVKGKDYYYYAARSCSDDEQVKLWQAELKEDIGKNIEVNPSFSGIISAMMSQKASRQVIIIDEFQNMLKYDNEFMESVIAAAHNKWNHQPVMFVLCSSSNYWIENQMVDRLKELAFEISGLLKLNEVHFSDFAKNFKNYEFEASVEAYSIIGGYPDLWEYWDDTKNVCENVCDLILRNGAPLNEYGKHILPAELREPVVYNTILSTLAINKNKLNEIHKYTGFSRAKISVYLKNLIELEIVEKVDSVNSPGRENSQKGIYRIRDPYIHFWYRYIFRNMSKMALMNSEKFYSKYIAPTFKTYTSLYFTRVCSEYLDNLNQNDKLRFRYTLRGVWIGKVGTIDIVAQNDEDRTLVALCNWENHIVTFADYEWLLFCIKQARLEVTDIYIFSTSDFDLELKQEEMIKEGLVLVDSTKLN